MDSLSLLQYLDSLSIHYKCHEHVPVFTSEQAHRLIPPLIGASAKNLFLRDRKGHRHFLLVFPDSKIMDFKSLSASMGLSGLSLASPERLMRFLGVTPGAVSIMALVNDPETRVEVLIDRELWQADYLQCHPLINTATLVISINDIKRFIAATNHPVALVTITPSSSSSV